MYAVRNGRLQNALSFSLLKTTVRLLIERLGIWEFPKIRGTLFWGPYNRNPAI